MLSLSCYCPAVPSNEDFYVNDGFGKSALLWGFEPTNVCGEKFIYGMAFVFEKSYFIRLRGTKEGQECSSTGHLEIFSMSSGERQRKKRGTLKE